MCVLSFSFFFEVWLTVSLCLSLSISVSFSISLSLSVLLALSGGGFLRALLFGVFVHFKMDSTRAWDVDRGHGHREGASSCCSPSCILENCSEDKHVGQIALCAHWGHRHQSPGGRHIGTLCCTRTVPLFLWHVDLALTNSEAQQENSSGVDLRAQHFYGVRTLTAVHP